MPPTFITPVLKPPAKTAPISTKPNNISACQQQPPAIDTVSRRHFCIKAAVLLSAALLEPRHPAQALPGLHLFPLQERLTNSYFLMRACETVSDARNVVRSNPVEKLSIQVHGLTPRGIDQAMRASKALVDAGVGPGAWIWPSVTTSSLETAEILAYNLNVRRERIIPEFSFLDARGVGALEGGKVSDVRKVIFENDTRSPVWRPMLGEDGTPNDSSEDVFVRVRQLLSKLETQYFGENIVIVAPDSDPVSVLQAALMGEDLTNHHKFEFLPGEVRKVQELVVDFTGTTVQRPKFETLSRPAKSQI